MTGIRLMSVSRALGLTLAVLLLAAACASSPGSDDVGSRSGSRSGSPRADAEAVIEPLSLGQWRQMKEAGMVRPECPIQRRDQLRSVRVNYIDFGGTEQRGQLVVNADVADSTSAFNCRRPDQINAPYRASPHANGRAVDINPRENPWKDLRCRCWFPTGRTKQRVEGPGVIVRGGLVWSLFRDEGWIWQDIDVPDYMHFDTGYPSRPHGGPRATKNRGG